MNADVDDEDGPWLSIVFDQIIKQPSETSLRVTQYTDTSVHWAGRKRGHESDQGGFH